MVLQNFFGGSTCPPGLILVVSVCWCEVCYLRATPVKISCRPITSCCHNTSARGNNNTKVDIYSPRLLGYLHQSYFSSESTASLQSHRHSVQLTLSTILHIDMTSNLRTLQQRFPAEAIRTPILRPSRETSTMNKTPIPPRTKPDTSGSGSRKPQSLHNSVARTLLSYNEIPQWHQDNDYILHGYRPISNSTLECFTSWSYLHNETVNIFSHLIPSFFALVIALALETVSTKLFLFHYPKATRGDIIAFALYLLSASLCLGISAAYHTLMNHSELVSNLWLRMDFLGIIILIEGCFVSGIYMTFYCEPSLQRLYWGMVR